MSSLALPAGALLAALLVRVYFGTLLPDTAIAKTGRPTLAIAHAGLQVIASSFVLGIGTLLLWLLSVVCLWRACRISHAAGEPVNSWWSSLIANAYFPMVLVLACIRGQRIEGVRHVLWTIEFSLAWNILQLVRWDRGHQEVQVMPAVFIRGAVYAVAVFPRSAAACRLGDRAASDGPARTNLHQDAELGFSSASRESCSRREHRLYWLLHRRPGLRSGRTVNGRAAAQSTPDQRYQSCAQKHPAALFLSSGQMEHRGGTSIYINGSLAGPMISSTCGSLDRHFLLVPAADGSLSSLQ